LLIAKTELIYLIRKKRKMKIGLIIINETIIKAILTAKLFNIVFDSELKWKYQIQQIFKRANKVVSVINDLRYLRPF
jgi:hypothetical protein